MLARQFGLNPAGDPVSNTQDQVGGKDAEHSVTLNLTIWMPDSKLAALYSGHALALVATKAEEVPSDGLNSPSFTLMMRHQPGQPKWTPTVPSTLEY